MGEKNVYLYSPYACFVCIYFATIFACMHVFMLLHLFCNYVRFYVDVVMDVTLSWCSECWSENLFSYFLCTCSLLMFTRMLEHVWEDLCRCWHKCCNMLMLIWEFAFLSCSVVHVPCCCYKKLEHVYLCDHDRSGSLGLLIGLLVGECSLNVPPRTREASQMDSYDGTTDPDEQIENIDAVLRYRSVQSAVKCKVFVTSLRRGAVT